MASFGAGRQGGSWKARKSVETRRYLPVVSNDVKVYAPVEFEHLDTPRLDWQSEIEIVDHLLLIGQMPDVEIFDGKEKDGKGILRRLRRLLRSRFDN